MTKLTDEDVRSIIKYYHNGAQYRINRPTLSYNYLGQPQKNKHIQTDYLLVFGLYETLMMVVSDHPYLAEPIRAILDQ